MSDLLAEAEGWLESQRVAHMSRAVTYSRGGRNAAVQATIGRKDYDLDNGYGVLVRFVSVDVLIRASELVLDGMEITPEPGDRIRETRNGRQYTYEVMALGEGPCYDLSDAETLRIHTKRVQEERL